MRILIFNWRDWQHPSAGGAEVYTHEVAERWVEQGHEVTLFCAGAPGLPALDLTEGVTIVRRGNRYSVYREAQRFYKNEGRGKYDLVVDEINTRPFLCPRFVDDAPVVALIHQVARDVWSYEFPLPVALAGRYLFEPRWLAAYRDVPVVTVSESSRLSLEQYGLHHVVTVPEGILLPRELPEVKKETSPTAIFCGRLSKNKRPDHAIEAFNILADRVPEANFWVVGAGKMLGRLRRQARPEISFMGRVSHDEKFELMAKAHVLVTTSVREGWGLVVSEAAAVGTPTVGYDVPGLCDSISASNGELVYPSPEALADRLETALPELADGDDWRPHPGGILPWSQVAAGILDAAGVGSDVVDSARA